jgi:hypothetical protein
MTCPIKYGNIDMNQELVKIRNVGSRNKERYNKQDNNEIK